MSILVQIIIVVVIIYLLHVRDLTEHGYRLMLELPWNQWLSLGEVVDMGYSRYYCEINIKAFYTTKSIEVRSKDSLSTEQEQLIQQMGFGYDTIDFHEFRLTKRGGRRRWKLLPTLSPVWKQATA